MNTPLKDAWALQMYEAFKGPEHVLNPGHRTWALKRFTPMRQGYLPFVEEDTAKMKVLEQLGFKFGAEHAQEKWLFQTTLPDGWSLDFSFSSGVYFYIRDDKSRARAVVRIQCFQESTDQVRIFTRYGVQSADKRKGTRLVTYLTDQEGTPYKRGFRHQKFKTRYDEEEARAAVNVRKRELDILFPDWENPLAYWS